MEVLTWKYSQIQVLSFQKLLCVFSEVSYFILASFPGSPLAPPFLLIVGARGEPEIKASLVPILCVPPSEKQSGEQSQIS